MLPDQWRMTYDDEDQGEARGLQRVDCDTSTWKIGGHLLAHAQLARAAGDRACCGIATRSKCPASTAAWPCSSAEIDGLTDVYVNGTRLNVAAAEPAKGQGGSRQEPGRRPRPRRPATAKARPAAARPSKWT